MAVAVRLPDEEVFTFSSETGGVSRIQALPELAVVRLTTAARTFDDKLVMAGARGTIVSVYDSGVAYDVEVSDPQGIVAVTASDIALAE